VLVAIAVMVLVFTAAAIALAANDPGGAGSEGIASRSVPRTGGRAGVAAGGGATGVGSSGPGATAPTDDSSNPAATTRAAGGPSTAEGPSPTTGAITGTTQEPTPPPTTSSTLLIVRIPANGSSDPLPIDLGSGCTGAADAGYASQLASSFTAYRSTAGLPAMDRSSALDAVALGWARTLACAGGGLSHNPDLESLVLGACGSCNGWAENVAYDSGPAGSMWSGWLGSTTHRDNIEDPHGGVFGIAVVRSPSGIYYGVQDFGRYP
jgi:uncharacterized protein YkwD